MSTIPLSKPYDESKVEFPGYLSQKLDGVPIRIDADFSDGVSYVARTRQGELAPSVDAQVNNFLSLIHQSGVIANGQHTFIAEVTHKHFRDFKDVSGVVRRQTQQEDLILNVFDYANWQTPDADFVERYIVATHIFQHFHADFVKLIPQYGVNEDTFSTVKEHLLDRWPNAEGLVYRSFKGKFEANKRRWNYMKILNEPTIDLRIVGFEEAVEGKTRRGKGMVGRLIADYHGTEVGIGPGKLTHKERVSLWKDWTDPTSDRDYTRIAQIKYKKDDSYAALRQPTFQYWRDDKDTTDA